MGSDDRSGWFEPGLLQHLPPDECRELLHAKAVGRVAFSGPEGPQVLPVNYVVLHGSIYFRTASGGTLANAVRDSRVAFEIDDIDDFLQSGWSVVAVGDAEFVDDPELLAELWGEHGPKPWAVGLRNQFVRITPIRLTGRRVLQT